MNKWQNPSLTLGERCVEFARNELANNVGEDKPKSYTSPRIREYFAITTRLINGKETKIPIQAANWCSSAVSFSLFNSLLPGELKPHGYRLGVVEIVADLQKNKSYFPKSAALNHIYKPKVGDPVIFDRSVPGDTATKWFRHIGFVNEVSPTSFTCISGNSGGKWRISGVKYDQPNLLGFGSYSHQTYLFSDVDNLIPDLSDEDILSLAPMEDTGSVVNPFDMI